MTRQLTPYAVACLLVLAGSATGRAQAQSDTIETEPVPLSVQVVISRYQGDELVSSLPYLLVLTSEEGSGSNMSIGAEVPVLQIAPVVNADGEPLPGVGRGGPFNYRHVGTEISCVLRQVVEDRYHLNISIEDSSVYGGIDSSVDRFRAPGAPVFRSFQSNNTLVLSPGQTTQYTAAADRISGQSVRVDVTLTLSEQGEPTNRR